MSNSLKTVGVLYKDLGTQQVTDKMEKREFVIETTDEQYPQLIKFELLNDKCKILDAYKAGEKIEVSFNLRGREWRKDANTPPAYFTNLAAWRIEKSGAVESQPQQSSGKAEVPAYPPSDGSDDLPF